MKTRILLLAALAVVVVITGCSGPGIQGDGMLTTTNMPIADFSALELSGGYEVQWSSGKPSLTISTDQNLLSHIATTSSGNSLRIKSTENLKPTKGIKIAVSSASLSDLHLNGAVNVTASRISGQELTLECSGASSVNLSGSVTKLQANLSGATKLIAGSLHTQDAKVSMSGACYGDVNASENLNASISGAGLLTYGGSPKSVEKSVSGVGKIQARP